MAERPEESQPDTLSPVLEDAEPESLHEVVQDEKHEFVRPASRDSRARRELSERIASTLRACDWASRNERNEPRDASKRSGWFHNRRKTSWTTSSASVVLLRTRQARPKTAPPWRRYTSARATSL